MPASRIRLSKLAARGSFAPRRLARLAKRRQEVTAFEAWQRASDRSASRQRTAIAKR
jgi:hypothetical protein